MSESNSTKKQTLEVVEPIGKRVLIRKDEDKKTTKSGIHLPDKIEIPTLTGRVVAVSAEVSSDLNYPIEQYDRVLFNPRKRFRWILRGTTGFSWCRSKMWWRSFANNEAELGDKVLPKSG